MTKRISFILLLIALGAIGTSLQIELFRLRRYLMQRYPRAWHNYNSWLIFGRYDEIRYMENIIECQADLKADKVIDAKMTELKSLRAMLVVGAVIVVLAVIVLAAH